MQSEQPGRNGPPALSSAALAVGVLLIAVALLWQVARSGTAARFAPPGPIGSLESVQLTNGLVLYGTLTDVSEDTVRLEPVYEVDVVSQPAGQAGQPPIRTTRLARRHASDWHGPGAIAIPIPQILFMEAVSSDSQVAKLISADEAPSGR